LQAFEAGYVCIEFFPVVVNTGCFVKIGVFKVFMLTAYPKGKLGKIADEPKVSFQGF
jgi:hypothetical protein